MLLKQTALNWGLNIGDACDDVNITTENDLVLEDCTCVGTLINCDDGNPCTDDMLDEILGCVYTSSLDTDQDGLCDNIDNCIDIANVDQADLDLDNIGDVCDSDADGDGILADTDCDDLDASVTTQPSDTCDDGDVTTNNDMVLEDCTCTGTPIDCDDGNPCTDDILDEILGCVYSPSLDSDEDGIL